MNVEALREAAQLFEGEHDFLSFAATDPELASQILDPDAEPDQRPIPRDGFTAVAPKSLFTIFEPGLPGASR
jgi:hypothetical protein